MSGVSFSKQSSPDIRTRAWCKLEPDQDHYVNFPDFEQNNTRIAAFGPSTAQAVREAGLVLDIEAPLIEAPSMTGALDMYIKDANQTK